MQKKGIIIIITLAIVFAVAVFSYIIFSKKKTVNVVDNKQETIINEQQIVDNSQQATVDNSQQVADSEKQITTDNVKENKKIVENKLPASDEKKSSAGKIVDKFISWGFQKSSDRKIDTIIIHSSYDALGKDPYSIDGIIAEYKQYEVSAHYLIARGGTIYHLVADKNIAWHAGVSKVPDGRTGVNEFSIGIEIVNTKDGKFTSDQYGALNSLLNNLKKQYTIKYVLGHDDIAPGRKTDPWGIDWSKVQK